MQSYAKNPSFSVGSSLTVCVSPSSTFSLAVFQQQAGEILTPVSGWNFETGDRASLFATVDKGQMVFKSDTALAAGTWDVDWNWPSITLSVSTAITQSSNVIVAAFDVDDQGHPVDDLGRRILAGSPIFPYRPDSGAMSLHVAIPNTHSTPAPMVYVIPVATYHAYNLTGNGCFYGYKPQESGNKQTYPARDLVTMRRPGGGLGAFMGDPPDYYDGCSQRQQFAHWDAKFTRWFALRSYACDFITDLEMHLGTVDLKQYSLVISGGHHEYWSQKMREALNGAVQAGANYACFSGNTCYRPISWQIPVSQTEVSLIRKDGSGWPSNNEWKTVGLTWAKGGGKWGTAGTYFQQWTETSRNPYGLQLNTGSASHWVFAGTNLIDGQTFGAADYLVGYEADGKSGDPQDTFQQLAYSPTLAGFNEGDNNQSSFGVRGDSAAPTKSGYLFNAGTTDWARVLMDPCADAYEVVNQITDNVIRTLAHL